MKTLKILFLFLLGMFVSASTITAESYIIEYNGKLYLVDSEQAIKTYRKREKVKKVLKYVGSALAVTGVIYGTDKYVVPMLIPNYSSPIAHHIDPYLQPVVIKIGDFYETHLKEKLTSLHTKCIETKYGKALHDNLKKGLQTTTDYLKKFLPLIETPKTPVDSVNK